MNLNMILKKSKLTYFFWGLLAITTIGALFTASIGFSVFFNQSGNVVYIAGSFAIAIVIAVIFVLSSKFFSNRLRNEGTDLSTFMEIIFLFFILIATFLTRFVCITSFKLPEHGAFHEYDLAVVSNWSDLFDMSGASLLFGRIMAFSIDNIGKSYMYGIYFNLILQLLSLIIVFLFVRAFASKVSALYATAFLGILPFNIFLPLEVDHEILFGFVMLLSLGAIMLICHLNINNKFSGFKGILLLIAAGILGGQLLYMDIAGISVLVVAFVMFRYYQNDDIYNKVSMRVCHNIVYTFAYIISFLFSMSNTADLLGKTYGDVFNIYFKNIDRIKINPIILSPGNNNIYSVILVILGLVWLIRLLMISRDHGSFIIFPTFVMTLVTFLGITNSTYSYANMIIWAIIAAIGLVSIGRNDLAYVDWEKEKIEQEKIDKQNRMEAAKKELEIKNFNDRQKQKQSILEAQRKATAAKAEAVTSEEKDDSIAALEASLEFLHPELVEDSEENEVKDNTLENDENKEDALENKSEENDNIDISEENAENADKEFNDDVKMSEADINSDAVNLSKDVVSLEKDITENDESSDKNDIIKIDQSNDELDVENQDNEGLGESADMEVFIKNDHANATALPLGQSTSTDKISVVNDHASSNILPVGLGNALPLTNSNAGQVQLPVGNASSSPFAGGATINNMSNIVTISEDNLEAAKADIKDEIKEVIKEDIEDIEVNLVKETSASDISVSHEGTDKVVEVSEPAVTDNYLDITTEEPIVVDTETTQAIANLFEGYDAPVNSVEDNSVIEHLVSEHETTEATEAPVIIEQADEISDSIAALEADLLKENIVEEVASDVIPTVDLPVAEFNVDKASENTSEPISELDELNSELDFIAKSNNAREFMDNIQDNNQENENINVSIPAKPPVVMEERPNVPIVKFGRRMDYKTAKVNNDTSESIILSTELPKKPNTVSVSSETRNISAPIKNPLPTPKKHVSRDLDFDVHVSDSEMHFDLVDLRGLDYFDIN